MDQPVGRRVGGRAPRNMGTCKAGFRKMAKTRMVCAKVGGRTCKSGRRLENGKCARAGLTEAQKARKKQLAKAYRIGKRLKKSMSSDTVRAAFRALKAVKRARGSKEKRQSQMQTRRSARLAITNG